MAASAADIARHLEVVDAERERRAASPGLLEKVTALKAFQQRRFSHTYADLLASARYGAAARYFLDELYGRRTSARATPSSPAWPRRSPASSRARSPRPSPS